MDKFGNCDNNKNSLSGKIQADDTAIALFQVQPDNHIQEPPKDSLDLTNVPNLNKLFCQEMHSIHFSQNVPLSDSFHVQNELYLDQISEENFEKCEFIISSCQSTWVGRRHNSILGWNSIKHRCPENARRIPSFPSKSSNRVFHYFQYYGRLHLTCSVAKVRWILTFYHEGVFRIVAGMFLQKKDQVINLIPLLGGFYTEQCLQHSTGKYIRGSGFEESLRQTRIFGVKMLILF